MVPLAFVLVGTYASGSQAVGSLMVTVYILSEVCCAPLAGRLLDRVGPAVGLPRVLGLAVVVWCGLALACALRAPAPVLFLLVALAAALGAGAPGAMRALLSQTVPPPLVAPAVALDAIAVEVVVVTAPLLVALTAAPSPPGAIIAMAAAIAMAAVLVRGQRRPVPMTKVSVDASAALGPRALWRNRRFAFWIAVGVTLGYSIGTAEIGALPRAIRLGGGPREAAALIAVLGISSALSGVVYASVAHRVGLGAVGRASILLAGLVVGSVELGLSAHWVTAAGAMVTLGLCCSPLGTVQSQAAEADAPVERQAEAFGILYAASGVGYALGGLFLALLPVREMLLFGAASALLALMLVPTLVRHAAL
jgi:MFS family permease